MLGYLQIHKPQPDFAIKLSKFEQVNFQKSPLLLSKHSTPWFAFQLVHYFLLIEDLVNDLTQPVPLLLRARL